MKNIAKGALLMGAFCMLRGHVIDFLDRNDPKKTNKPFFVWYNPARMHITTVLSPKYMAMVGEPGGKDWGVNEAGMKQMDEIRVSQELVLDPVKLPCEPSFAIVSV